MTEISFFAYGNPAPQGSKRFVGKNKSGHGVMVEMSKNLPSWRSAVIDYASVAYDGPPLDGALELFVLFWFPRTTTARKNATWKTPAPDLSKLVRSTEDALKIAGLIIDDARIVRLVTEKRYVTTDNNRVGADIRISTLDNGERR